MDKRSSQICIGDLIYLESTTESINNNENFSQTNSQRFKKTYLCSNGFYDLEVNFISDSNFSIKSFRNCIFMILPAMIIPEKESLEENIKRILEFTNSPEEKTKFMELLHKKNIESQEKNTDLQELFSKLKGETKHEQEVSIQEIFHDSKGQPIKQYQKVQFFNIESQKFLKVNKKAHANQANLHSFSLTENSSLSTAFLIIDDPFERETELIYYNKSIEIISCLNNQAIVCGSFLETNQSNNQVNITNNLITSESYSYSSKITEKPNEYRGFQINIADDRKEPILDAQEIYFAGTRSSPNQKYLYFRCFLTWEMNEAIKSTQKIKNSDYIRIKNSNAYLTYSKINDFKVPLFSFNLLQNYPFHHIDTIFQVIEIIKDPSDIQKGDLVLGMNSIIGKPKQYVLKHLRSGKLLKLQKTNTGIYGNLMSDQQSQGTPIQIDKIDDAKLSFIFHQSSVEIDEVQLTYGKEVGIAFNNMNEASYIHNKFKKTFSYKSEDETNNHFYMGPKQPIQRICNIEETQFTEMDITSTSKDYSSAIFRMIIEKVPDKEIHRILDFESFIKQLKKFNELLKICISKSDFMTKELAKYKKLIRRFHESLIKDIHIEIYPEKIKINNNINDILAREFNLFDHIFNLLMVIFDNEDLCSFFRELINHDDIEDANHESHKIWKFAFPEIIIDLLELFLRAFNNNQTNADYCSIYLKFFINIALEYRTPFLNLLSNNKIHIKKVALDIVKIIVTEYNYNSLDYIIPEILFSPLKSDHPFIMEHLIILEQFINIKTSIRSNIVMRILISKIEDIDLRMIIFPSIEEIDSQYSFVFKTKSNKEYITVSDIYERKKGEVGYNYYLYIVSIFKLINRILSKNDPKFFDIINVYYPISSLKKLMGLTHDTKIKILITEILFHYYRNINQKYLRPLIDKWDIYMNKTIEKQFGLEKFEHVDEISQIIKDQSHFVSIIDGPHKTNSSEFGGGKKIQPNNEIHLNAYNNTSLGSLQNSSIERKSNNAELLDLFEVMLNTPNYHCENQIILMIFKRCMEILSASSDNDYNELSPRMISKALNIAVTLEDRMMQTKTIALGKKIRKKWNRNNPTLENPEIKSMIEFEIEHWTNKKIEQISPYTAETIQQILLNHFLKEEFVNFDISLKKLIKVTNVKKEFLDIMTNIVFMDTKEDNTNLQHFLHFFKLIQLIEINYERLLGKRDIDLDVENVITNRKEKSNIIENSEDTINNSAHPLNKKTIELVPLVSDTSIKNPFDLESPKYERLKNGNNKKEYSEKLLCYLDEVFNLIYQHKPRLISFSSNSSNEGLSIIVNLSKEQSWAPFYIKKSDINIRNQKIFFHLGVAKILMNIIKTFSFFNENPLALDKEEANLTYQILKSATILFYILYEINHGFSIYIKDIQDDLLQLLIGISREQVKDKSVIFMITQLANKGKFNEICNQKLELLYYRYSYGLIKGQDIPKEYMCFLAFGLEFILKSDCVMKYSKMIPKMIDILIFNILQWEDFNINNIFDQYSKKVMSSNISISMSDGYYCIYSIFNALKNSETKISNTEIPKRLSQFPWNDLLKHKNMLFQFELRSLIVDTILSLFLAESSESFLDLFEDYNSFFGMIFWDIDLYIQLKNHKNQFSAFFNEILWLKNILIKHHIAFKNMNENYSKYTELLSPKIIENLLVRIHYNDLKLVEMWDNYIYKHLIKLMMEMIKVKQLNTIREINLDSKHNHKTSYLMIQLKLINWLYSLKNEDIDLIKNIYNFFSSIASLKVYSNAHNYIKSSKKEINKNLEKKFGEKIEENFEEKSWEKIEKKIKEQNEKEMKEKHHESEEDKGKDKHFKDLESYIDEFIANNFKSKDMYSLDIDSLSMIIYESKNFPSVTKKLIGYLDLEPNNRPSTSIVLRILARIIELLNTHWLKLEGNKTIYEWDGVNPVDLQKIQRVMLVYQKSGLTKVIFKMLLHVKHPWEMYEVLYVALAYSYGGQSSIQQEFYDLFVLSKDNRIITMIATHFKAGLDLIVNQGHYLIHNKGSSENGNFEQYLTMILLFIQCLCEGQFVSFQKFFRCQQLNGEIFDNSFDFLDCIQHFCQNYVSICHYANLDLGIEIMTILKYLIDGIHQNIDQIINRTFIPQITALLTKSNNRKFLESRGLISDGSREKNLIVHKFNVLRHRIAIIIKILAENATDAQKEIIKQFLDIKGLIECFHTSMKDFIIRKHFKLKKLDPLPTVDKNSQDNILHQCIEDPERLINQLTDDDFDVILLTAINIFISIRSLYRNDHEFTEALNDFLDEIEISEKNKFIEECDILFLKFAKKIIRNIEIVLKDKDNNRLIRIWYPLYVRCRFLHEDSKSTFLENVDRANAQTKLTGLLKASHQILPQMDEEYDMRSIFKGLNYVKIYDTMRTISNLIAIVSSIVNIATEINSNFVTNNTSNNSSEVEELSNSIIAYQDPNYYQLITNLIIVQIVIGFLLLLFRVAFFRLRRITVDWMRYCQKMTEIYGSLPEIIKSKLYEGRTDLTEEECLLVLKLKGPNSSEFKAIERYPHLYKHVKMKKLFFNLKFIFCSYNLCWNLIYIILCFLGQQYHPLVALLTIDIAVRSNTIKRITECITRNKVPFMWTLYLLITVVVIYSFLGFYFLNGYFVDKDAGLLCKDLFQCFLIVLDYGIKDPGGIGDDMVKPTYYRETNMWGILGFVGYTFSFFMIEVAVLLNLVFGMIIDSFGEIRDKKRENDENQRNVCFVCDKERGEYQKYGDFNMHIENEHCPWDYLFYIIYLKKKAWNIAEITSIESYVMKKFEINSTEWFPIDRSLTVEYAINEDEKKEEKGLEKIKISLEGINKELEKLEKLEIDTEDTK